MVVYRFTLAQIRNSPAYRRASYRSKHNLTLAELNRRFGPSIAGHRRRRSSPRRYSATSSYYRRRSPSRRRRSSYYYDDYYDDYYYYPRRRNNYYYVTSDHQPYAQYYPQQRYSRVRDTGVDAGGGSSNREMTASPNYRAKFTHPPGQRDLEPHERLG